MTHEEPSDTDFELLARDVSGEMSARERAEWEVRLAASASLRSARLAAAAHWEAARETPAIDIEAAWKGLETRLHRSDVRIIHVGRRNWFGSVTFMRAAAAVIVVVGGVATWRAMTPQRVTAAAVGVNASTRATEQREVTLPDGSVVVLAAASTVRTVGDYGNGAREVELVGEAQFTVTHDESRPFRIRTAGALIEDLGTVFTVRAMPNEALRVAVSEGSVRVRRSGAPEAAAIVLQPRDVAVVADTGDPVVTRGVEVDVYQAWTRGRHEFKNTPAAEVFNDVERWFDVDFQVSDSTLLSRPLNVPFDRSSSVDEVLEVLGQVLDVTFERRGRVVTIAAPTRTGLRSTLPTTQVGSGV